MGGSGGKLKQWETDCVAPIQIFTKILPGVVAHRLNFWEAEPFVQSQEAKILLHQCFPFHLKPKRNLKESGGRREWMR